MPTIARVVDEIRDVFGEDVKVLYAKENGFELGRPPDSKGVFTAPLRLPQLSTNQLPRNQARKSVAKSSKTKAQDQKSQQLDRLLQSGQLRLGG
jgi:hypothetical protein